jgi:prolyl-tRNA synthetase
MFADWELIGVPLRVVLSERGLKAGTVEVQGRRETTAAALALAEAVAHVKAHLLTPAA